jgi:hypothetical protein
VKQIPCISTKPVQRQLRGGYQPPRSPHPTRKQSTPPSHRNSSPIPPSTGQPCPTNTTMSSPDAAKVPGSPIQNPVRSFTLPSRIANKPRPTSLPPPTATADGIETLFVCNSAKIVQFSSSVLHRPGSPTKRRYGHAKGDDATRSIPWWSPTERTMAVG